MRRVMVTVVHAVAASLAALSLAACTGSGSGSGAAQGAGTATGTSPVTTGAEPFPVAENRLPGNGGWRIAGQGAPNAIEGYASAQSVLPGQEFKLFVSTTASSFRVEAYRFGWYRGTQARLVWKSPPVPGKQQAAAATAAGTHMVTAPWQPSLTVQTGGWPPGAYLLKLVSSDGPQRYVPITVRSVSTSGKVVIVLDNTTWQAYNTWGGYSLYQGPDGLGADRGYQVSFDRPYDGDGAIKFLAFDQAAIGLAERAGVALAYETDVDMDAVPGLLTGARAVITLGHDEYYSLKMRQALITARDGGTNLAFLGANAIYRHIRFTDGHREIICYKEAALDPLDGTDNQDTTQQWRQAPDPRPESVLTGVFYECNPVSAPWVVYNPDSWIFEGTGAYRGESFPGLVGPEYDRVNPGVPYPRPMTILAHSPLTCDGTASYSDTVYYTAPSGAGVFASGTMRWVCAIRGGLCGHGVNWRTQKFVDRATLNILRAFAEGPAGRPHPAADNIKTVNPPSIPALSGGID